MTSAPPIAFDYRGSVVLLLATLVIAALAAMALVLSGLPSLLRLALVIAVVVAAVRTTMTLLRPRVRSVLWRTDGSIEVETRDRVLEDAASQEGQLRGARVLGPLVVLRLRWQRSETAALWLLPDNTDADVLRRLCVRIRAGIDADSDADDAM